MVSFNVLSTLDFHTLSAVEETVEENLGRER
jgi:hypothetical protein